MDKEAQGVIRRIMRENSDWYRLKDEDFEETAEGILQELDKLGYRKLPKDKPPLLSKRKILKIYKGKGRNWIIFDPRFTSCGSNSSSPKGSRC